MDFDACLCVSARTHIYRLLLMQICIQCEKYLSFKLLQELWGKRGGAISKGNACVFQALFMGDLHDNLVRTLENI